MSAYYNEHDPKAAEWIRELIKAGLVADGDVDERSIEDVIPNDLRKYTQCHFFAGIAVWSHALRSAGWPDDRAVWTGSCPCQPFSAAGKGEGFADERHLWPAWFHLIDQLRPVTVFGEQVSSKDGLTWLDLVSNDLESADYTVRAVDIPACSVGAPHRRNRFYFVADTNRGRLEGTEARRWEGRCSDVVCESDTSIVADTAHRRTERRSGEKSRENEKILRRPECNESGDSGPTDGLAITPTLGRRGRGNGDSTGNGGQIQVAGRSSSSGLGDANGRRREQWDAAERDIQEPDAGRSTDILENAELSQGPRLGQHSGEILRNEETSGSGGSGPANGFWRDAEWLYCTDDKYRAVEPGTFPLSYGTSGRVGLLRGYGNAIVAPLATAFIESYLDAVCRTSRR